MSVAAVRRCGTFPQGGRSPGPAAPGHSAGSVTGSAASATVMASALDGVAVFASPSHSVRSAFSTPHTGQSSSMASVVQRVVQIHSASGCFPASPLSSPPHSSQTYPQGVPSIAGEFIVLLPHYRTQPLQWWNTAAARKCYSSDFPPSSVTSNLCFISLRELVRLYWTVRRTMFSLSAIS